MNSLVCPFCNTPFDLPGVPGRVVCPRCGEAIPAKLLPAATVAPRASEDRPAPPEVAPATSGSRIARKVAVLLAAAAVALGGVWYFTVGKPPETVSTLPLFSPPPTRPPMALTALRHLPPDTQIVAALQPSPLFQYADRVGKKPETLLAELGLPAGLFEGLAKAGIPLQQIDHAAVGLGLADSIKLSVVLYLRKPVENEGHFREVLKVRQNADKPGRATADLPGLPIPVEMHKIDGTTYLFSSDGQALDAMLKPQENANFLKAGLRESIGKLDSASFAWVATDHQNWADLPTVKLLAALAKREEFPKRLKGMRALALGLTLRPDLNGVMAVRLADAAAAAEFDARAKAKLGGPDTMFAVDNDWRTVQVAGSSFANGVPSGLALFDP